MTREEKAIIYFKDLRKKFCEDYLLCIPQNTIAYKATMAEKEFYDTAIKALEQTRWISCSKKSPDKNEWLALLYDNGLVSGGEYLGDRTYDVDFPDQNKKTKVVAWMPLPQSYKTESENKG